MSEIASSCITAVNEVGRSFWGYAAGMFVQVSLLVVALLVMDCFLRRHVRAALRYWIWMLVFVKLLLPTGLAVPTGAGYWLGRYIQPIWLALSQDQGSYPLPLAVEARTLPVATPEMALPEAPVASLGPTPPHGESLTWQGGVFLLWGIGMLVLIGLVIQRWFFVRKLIEEGEPAPDDLVELLDRCRLQTKVHAPMDIKLIPNTLSPAVCGLGKATILMPKTMLERLSPEDMRAVLIHELAHVKRADMWFNTFQTVLQVVYFYNPLVWLANAIVRRVREQAVDEMVLVALGAEARSYSNTLIDIAEMAFLRVSPALSLVGVAESKRSLEGRIKHMVTRPIPKDTGIGVRGVLAIVMIGAFLLPMATAEPRNQQEIPGLPEEIAELFGLSKDDIVTQFGKDCYIFYGDNRYTLDNLPDHYFMSYREVGLSFAVAKGHVGGITLLSPDYVFSNGIRVGVSETEVAEAFGTDCEFKETSFKDFLTYKDLGLSFEVNKDDRTVMEINIDEDYGSPARRRAWAEAAAFAQILPEKIARLKIDSVDLAGVKAIFGEPLKYIWKNDTFEADDLPIRFIMVYPASFNVFMSENRIVELRHEGPRSGYVLEGGIRVGSTLEEVLAVYGDPRKTVEGESVDWHDADNVLFKNIDGGEGHDYYYLPEKDLRLWFGGHKLMAIYMTRSDYGGDKDDEPSDPEFVRLLAQRIEQLNIDSADRQRVMEIFGEPLKYIWGNKTFDADNLPDRFIMMYPSGFRVFMSQGRIVEIRHERPGTGYTFKGGIRMGSTVEEVLAVLGAPKKTVQGKPIEWQDSHNVLYRDIDGDKGHDYYHCPEQDVRLWFWNDKVIAIYMTRSDYD